jgi:hypothetical protein
MWKRWNLSESQKLLAWVSGISVWQWVTSFTESSWWKGWNFTGVTNFINPFKVPYSLLTAVCKSNDTHLKIVRRKQFNTPDLQADFLLILNRFTCEWVCSTAGKSGFHIIPNFPSRVCNLNVRKIRVSDLDQTQQRLSLHHLPADWHEFEWLLTVKSRQSSHILPFGLISRHPVRNEYSVLINSSILRGGHHVCFISGMHTNHCLYSNFQHHPNLCKSVNK